MTDRKKDQPVQPVPDEVAEAGRESFPASDPPAHSGNVGPSDAPPFDPDEEKHDDPEPAEEADS